MSVTPYQASSAIVLGIGGWGDQVVGQALALLLSSAGYETRFLPASSLIAPGTFKDVQILLLPPMPKLSIERREALMASLKDAPRGREILVLELVTPSEKSRAGASQKETWRAVPWPCSIKDLERRIEAALAVSTQQQQLSSLP